MGPEWENVVTHIKCDEIPYIPFFAQQSTSSFFFFQLCSTASLDPMAKCRLGVAGVTFPYKGPRMGKCYTY